MSRILGWGSATLIPKHIRNALVADLCPAKSYILCLESVWWKCSALKSGCLWQARAFKGSFRQQMSCALCWDCPGLSKIHDQRLKLKHQSWCHLSPRTWIKSSNERRLGNSRSWTQGFFANELASMHSVVVCLLNASSPTWLSNHKHW